MKHHFKTGIFHKRRDIVLYFPYLAGVAGCIPLRRHDGIVARKLPSLHPQSYLLQTTFRNENNLPWRAWFPSAAGSEPPQRCCLHLHQRHVPAGRMDHMSCSNDDINRFIPLASHAQSPPSSPDPAHASGKLLAVQLVRPSCSACAQAP